MGLLEKGPVDAGKSAQRHILEMGLQYSVLNVFKSETPGIYMILAKKMGSYDDYAVWPSWDQTNKCFIEAGISSIKTIDEAYETLAELFLEQTEGIILCS